MDFSNETQFSYIQKLAFFYDLTIPQLAVKSRLQPGTIYNIKHRPAKFSTFAAIKLALPELDLELLESLPTKR